MKTKTKTELLKEFNLSEKRRYELGEYIYSEFSVKEFIRLLKEVIDSQKETDLDYSVWLESQIDKLAGSKLIEEKKE